MVYTDWSTGNLAIRDLVQGSSRQVTTDGNVTTNDVAFAGNAVLSRDGQQIAYNWSTSTSTELRVIAVTGGEARTIDPGRGAEALVVHGWSPNGDALLVVRSTASRGLREIGMLDIATARFASLRHSGRVGSASLSPDGRFVAWAELRADDPTRRQIRLLDQQSRASMLLSTGKGDDYSPTFTADGRGIVFLSDRGAVPGIWHVSLSPAGAPGTARSLRPLPDAHNTILGVSDEGTVFVGAYDIGGERAFVARVDWTTGIVSNERELRRSPFTRTRRASFSPDGNRVAFLRKIPGAEVRPGWQTAVVQSLDGSAEREYRTKLTLRDEPMWHPDGRALVIAAPAEGTSGEAGDQAYSFVRLDLATGVYQLAASASAAGRARVAAVTKRSIIYIVNQDAAGSGMLREREGKTGSDRLLYRANTAIADAALSPDGRSIAVAVGRTVFVLSPPDTVAVRVGSVRTNARSQLSWFPDGRSIVISGRIGEEQGIWRAPVDGGAPTRLQIEANDITEVRLTPDARWIAWTRNDRNPREVLAFEGILNR